MSSSSSASDVDSDSDSVQRRVIQESYAKAIALKRKREEEDDEREKSRLRKQGRASAPEGEPLSESESEDDDGWNEGPAADAALLKTLALIQKRDPAIYDPSKPIFEEARQQMSESSAVVRRIKKEKVSKPVTYKSQAAAALLGVGEDVEVPKLLTHVEEQAALRSETISAFHQAVDDDDDLLVLRTDKKDDADMEEDEYREFIQREVGDILPGKTPDAIKHGSNMQEQSTQADEFLTNYLLNRSWIDHKARRLPTFDEVTGKGKGKHDGPSLDDDEMDSDFEELEEDFEATYNFRYEEPDGSKIPRYPREIDSLARRKETTRKEARERKKDRKEEAFKKKKEEVRRMKNTKSKELKNKVLDMLGSEGGVDRVEAKRALDALNLDDDFDPDAWDKQMTALYQNEEEEDIEKPQWDDEEIDEGEGDGHLQPDEEVPTEEIGDEPEATSRKRKKKKKKKSSNGMQEAVVDPDEMDAEAVPQNAAHDEEQWDGTEEMRKRVLDQYMEEIYKMDFNDMVGDMPTRFKYASTPKTKYSLSATQILLATDKELNNYVGMKSLAPHKRRDAWDPQRGKKLGDFKKSIAGRTWGYSGRPSRPTSSSTGSSKLDRQHMEQRKKKMKKGKKERQMEKAAVAGAIEGSPT